MGQHMCFINDIDTGSGIKWQVTMRGIQPQYKKGETFSFSDNVCLDLFMDAAKNTHLIE